MSETYRIVTKKSLCSGCLSCMAVCPEANDGYNSPSSSRIQIGLDFFAGDTDIAICRQCKDAACARACPACAIALDSERQVWRVDYGRCIGCRSCVDACPFSSMFFDVYADRVIKCEQCAGRERPLCVDVCPTGALSIKVSQR